MVRQATIMPPIEIFLSSCIVVPLICQKEPINQASKSEPLHTAFLFALPQRLDEKLSRPAAVKDAPN